MQSHQSPSSSAHQRMSLYWKKMNSWLRPSPREFVLDAIVKLGRGDICIALGSELYGIQNVFDVMLAICQFLMKSLAYLIITLTINPATRNCITPSVMFAKTISP